MASTREDIIFRVAQRLRIEGVSVKEAEAFHRVLANKDISKSINCTTKAVLCLDLAASQSGVSFDKDNAIKVSGVKKSIYQNHLNNVECVLQLNKPITVSAITVKMSCIGIRTFAEEILDKYQLHNMQLDFNHPQYPVVAVYTACKLKGVKVSRREFTTMSKLKTGAWKELENEFSKFVNKIEFKTSPQKSSSNEFYKSLERQGDSYYNDQIQLQSALETNVEVEEYEVWKKRILDEARRQLKFVC